MMLLPIRAELSLSRMPILNVLVCLLCVAVFYNQLANWQQIKDQSIEFCQQNHGRIFDMVLKNVYGEYGENGCQEFVLSSSQNKLPKLAIDQAISRMTPFVNMSHAESKLLASKRLKNKYNSYQNSVSADLTTELAYDPRHYSLYNMFTATVAHSDWSHILGNLIIFFAFAASVEVALGYWRYLLAYVVLAISTAVSYSIAMSMVASSLPTIGLSGVAMGMIGLFMYLLPFGRIRCLFWFIFIIRFVSIPAWILATWFIGWDLYNLFSTENQSNINFVAHVSGACFGYLFGVTFCGKIKQRIAFEINGERRSHRRQRETPTSRAYRNQ